MNRFRACLALLMILMLMAGVFIPVNGGVRAENVQPKTFVIPEGITQIGSEAFAGIALFDVIHIPESVVSIADDAFGVLRGVTIYGAEGSEAEAFAARAGLDFVSADIEILSFDAADWTSPFVPYTVSLSARCEGAQPTYYFYALLPDGETVYMQSGDTPQSQHTFLFEQGGEYIIRAVCVNGAISREVTSPVTVALPLALYSDADEVFVEVEQSAQIISSAETRAVTLSADAPGIVRINGLSVEGVTAGECVITAKAHTDKGDVFAFIPVTVTVPVSGIEIIDPPQSLPIGATLTLGARVSPDDAYDKTVTWRVEDEAVAVISADGALTGVSRGVTNVFASAGRAEDAFALRVIKPVEQINIAPEGGMPAEFLTGQTIKLITSALPEDADDKTVTWSSEDARIASVNSNGVVTGVSAGQTRIFATATDAGKAVGEFTINVSQGAERIDIICSSDIPVGETVIASAIISPSGAADKTVVWSSGDERVMSVDAAGRVTALAGGAATLRATAVNGVTAETQIMCVVRETGIFSALDTLYLTQKVNTCNPYDFMYVKPLNATYRALTWTSSNPSAISVDANTGLITALVKGTAVITATSRHGLTKSITVNAVTDGEVISGMSLVSSYITLNQGQSAPNSISGLSGSPSTKYRSGTWFSDNESVATVLAVNGATTITGVSPGAANIYAVSSSGRVSKCEVLVNPSVERGITLNERALTLDPGERFTLIATLLPEQSYFDSVKWSSSAPAVATVSGGVVSALAEGEALITATTGMGLKATCAVSVNRVVNMASAALTQSVLSGVIGDKLQVTYTYGPSNAHPARFLWQSDNALIADVDAATGLISCLSPGECVITGVATDLSGIRLTARVSVTGVPVSGISLGEASFTLGWNESRALTPAISPEGANHAGITYFSSDASIASVDSNGVVRALSEGICVITARVGAYAASVNVSVTAREDVSYRALVVGEFTNPASATSFLPFSTNGTTGVKDALSRSALDGKRYSVNLLGSSPSKSQIFAAINSLAASADSDDVTVIYIITHGGNNSGKGGYYMEINDSGDYINSAALLERVKGISGHVFLVICTCRSGYMLASSASSALMSAGGAYNGNHGAGYLSILCSSANTISSYYDTADTSLSRDFFTYAFLRGLGWDMISDSYLGYLPADSNGDGRLSVSEIARYSRVHTQSAISAFIQANGTSQFNGDDQQYPRWFIADGDEDLIIYGR